MRELDKDECERIESYIDAAGIDMVLAAISEICAEKAEHIAVNWQDTKLAKRWLNVGTAILGVVPKAGGL